jgi:hypothetical protein
LTESSVIAVDTPSQSKIVLLSQGHVFIMQLT